MEKIRKLATSIDMLCNGAEDDHEYSNGVNILLNCLGVDAEDSKKIRTRLNVSSSDVLTEGVNTSSFISTLTKKPVQYSRMSDREIRKLVQSTTDNINMEKIVVDVLTEIIQYGRSKNIAFNEYDRSHFLCMCLEKIGVDMTEGMSSIILEIK